VLDFRGPVGDDSGYCLMAVPGLDGPIPGAFIDLGDDAKGRVSPSVVAKCRNALGINLTERTPGRIGAEMVTAWARTDGTRCHPLGGKRKRIVLAEAEIYDELGGWADLQNAYLSETWPTNGTTVETGQDLSWSAHSASMEVASGRARANSTGFSNATCLTNTGSANMFAQSVVQWPTLGASGQRLAGVQVRMTNYWDLDGNAFQFQWYYQNGLGGVDAIRWAAFGYNYVAAGTAQVQVAATDYTMYIEAAASNAYTFKINGVTKLTSTDTNVGAMTGQRGGIWSDALNAVGDITFDNYAQGQIGETAPGANIKRWGGIPFAGASRKGQW
jgi:hypothetical protein